MTKLTIALDAMGGDRGPAIVVAALEKALQTFPNIHFLLIGDEQRLQALLRRHKSVDTSRVSVRHASQIVEMNDKPGQILRHKTDSSMRVAIDAVASDEAQACVSAGNTGALMAMAYLNLKTIPGVIRPALVASLPNKAGSQSLLLDLGANPVCDAETLFQFGVMGSVLASEVLHIESPRVGLLNMGSEDIKGPDNVRQAGVLMANTHAINYQGFVEGSDIFSDIADVIVCDGYTGNVALKSCEGMARLVADNLKRALTGHWLSRGLAWLLYKRFKSSLEALNPDQYNGASLLGLRGVVMKSHGNASANAYYSAIRQAIAEAEIQLPQRIHDRIESVLSEEQS